MLHTKIELLKLQQRLAEPSANAHMAISTGNLDSNALAIVEETIDSQASVLRAMHLMTERMLVAQERWEQKKAAIETARSIDFANALMSIKAVVAAATGSSPVVQVAPSALPSAPRPAFLNRGSSVINRALAQQKSPLFPNSNTISPRAGAGQNFGVSSASIASITPSPRAGTRLQDRRLPGVTTAAVAAGAGDVLLLPHPPGLRPALRADTVTELGAIATSGTLPAQAGVAVSKLAAVGGNEHVLTTAAITGTEYRRKFTQ
jgi:hypothetical protein